MSTYPDVNIVSLGAGYDTTYFWLLENHDEASKGLCYIELDFDRVVERKIEIIKKNLG